MRTFATSLFVVLAGTAALAGCSSTPGLPAAAAPPVTAAPPASGVPAPAAAGSAPATATVNTPPVRGSASAGPVTGPKTGSGSGAAQPPGAAAPPATSAADPCPVTVITLLSALRDSPDFYRRAAKPAALQEAACTSGYAVAGTTYDGQHQTTEIVFGYDAATARWRPLNLGSADFCEGYVPAEVAPKLAGCS